MYGLENNNQHFLYIYMYSHLNSEKKLWHTKATTLKLSTLDSSQQGFCYKEKNLPTSSSKDAIVTTIYFPIKARLSPLIVLQGAGNETSTAEFHTNNRFSYGIRNINPHAELTCI